MKRLSVSLGAAVGLLMISTAVFAHHGTARLRPDPAGNYAEIYYEGNSPVTLQGTVTKFRFINPHVLIYFEVKDEHGKIVTWVAESSPPQRLFRAGWKKDTLKPGDKITVIGTPWEGGAKMLVFRKLVAPDGRELGSYEPETE